MQISEEFSRSISNVTKYSKWLAVTNIVVHSVLLGLCIISITYIGIRKPFSDDGRCHLCGMGEAIFILGLIVTVGVGISLLMGIQLFFGVKQRSKSKCVAWICWQILILLCPPSLFAGIVISTATWLPWGWTLLTVALIVVQILQVALIIRFVREINNDEQSNRIV